MTMIISSLVPDSSYLGQHINLQHASLLKKKEINLKAESRGYLLALFLYKYSGQRICNKITANPNS